MFFHEIKAPLWENIFNLRNPRRYHYYYKDYYTHR